jgi:hypothetical protein
MYIEERKRKKKKSANETHILIKKKYAVHVKENEFFKQCITKKKYYFSKTRFFEIIHLNSYYIFFFQIMHSDTFHTERSFI